MNAKYAVALLLTLQVSMSLCDVPAEMEDLTTKYKGMREMFLSRLMNAKEKLQTKLSAMAGADSDSTAKQYLTDYASELETLHKVALSVSTDIMPLVEQARQKLLSVYQENMRAEVGGYLDNTIRRIKIILDEFLPVPQTA